jgi:hypothetical protein
VTSVLGCEPSCPTAGGTNLTVLGARFDLSVIELSVRVEGHLCRILEQNDSRIVCAMPAGRGVDQTVVVRSTPSLVPWACLPTQTAHGSRGWDVRT